jgi:hypothetical protein
MEKRVSFLIDGFNLYHSISQATQGDEFRKCKWLDLGQLCHSTLHIVDSKAKIARIHYFTATRTTLKKLTQINFRGIGFTCEHLLRLEVQLSPFTKVGFANRQY